jgi:sugar phosphate isomerase/epimerase
VSHIILPSYQFRVLSYHKFYSIVFSKKRNLRESLQEISEKSVLHSGTYAIDLASTTLNLTMKLAFSSNAFKKFSLEQCIPLISKIGYSGIEILCDVPHAYPPKDIDVAKIRSLLSKHNLEISNLNSFTLYAIKDTYHPSWIEVKSSLRRIRLEHTKNCLELAHRLGCKLVSTEGGGPLPEKSYHSLTLRRRFKKEVNTLSRYAEDQEIKVLIEPEPGLLLENSRDFLSFIKGIESQYIRLNFDIAHFYCVKEDPAETIHRLSDYIEHFHLSDIATSRIHNHLIPGEGSIDFKSVFRAIVEFGYKGYVTVELYPYQNNPVFAGAKAFEFLRSLILEL